MGRGNYEPEEFLPSDEERIQEMFEDIELEEALEAIDEDAFPDEILDFTEAGFEPGDF